MIPARQPGGSAAPFGQHHSCSLHRRPEWRRWRPTGSPPLPGSLESRPISPFGRPVRGVKFSVQSSAPRLDRWGRHGAPEMGGEMSRTVNKVILVGHIGRDPRREDHGDGDEGGPRLPGHEPAEGGRRNGGGRTGTASPSGTGWPSSRRTTCTGGTRCTWRGGWPTTATSGTGSPSPPPT